jgi:hypothetical protein
MKMGNLKIIPPDESGRIVGVSVLQGWVTQGDWFQWKDIQDAELGTMVESELLNRKIEVIKEQLAQTKVVRDKAYEAIKDGKFDTSASAVAAFFRAGETERGLMQIEKWFEEYSKTQTSDLQKQFRELAERAGATIVDGEEKIEDSAESIDT